MPASRQSSPTSLSSRIRLWLLDHPGQHRPSQIAAGLGIPAGVAKQKWTQKVANECARMANPAQGRRRTLDRVEEPGWWGKSYQLASETDEQPEADTA